MADLESLILGAIGVILMFPITVAVYRHFVGKYAAKETPRAFVRVANDREFVDGLKQTLLWTELTENPRIIQLDSQIRALELPKDLGDQIKKVVAGQEILEGRIKAGLLEAFSQFEGALSSNLKRDLIDALTQKRGAMGNPSEAQSEAVLSRKAGQIVQVLETSALGQMGAIDELKQVLIENGQDDLADYLDEHPKTVNYVMRRIKSNPALARRLAEIQAGQFQLQGGGPGNGSRIQFAERVR